MAQLMMILMVAVLMVRDQIGKPRLLRVVGPSGAALATIGAMLAIAVVTHLLLAWARRRMERNGSLGMVIFSDRVVAGSRWFVLTAHIAAVLLFGWLDAVRRVTGNLIVIDELLALVPALLAMASAWWSMYPIDRNLREAVVMRNLDTGIPLHKPPTRMQFVSMQVQHQILLILVPMIALMAWSEGLRKLIEGMLKTARQPQLRWDSWYDRASAWLAQSGQAENIHALVQVVGMVVVFSFMPAVLRFIWNTIPLGEGELRDRLLALCATHRVRIRELLVWRTHGSMANGAVIGLWGRLRYVLLSDVLLDRLGTREVEAVMAHEVGHVRRKHMVWLAVALMACTGGLAAITGTIALTAAKLAGVPDTLLDSIVGGAIEIGSSVLGLSVGLIMFGWISRRFEWQADAFAAQHLSGLVTGHRVAASTQSELAISEEAATAMVGALKAVVRINHMDPHAFSWRHGSVSRRISNLRALIGRPARALPIDRTVIWIKVVCGLTTAGLIALAVFQGLMAASAE